MVSFFWERASGFMNNNGKTNRYALLRQYVWILIYTIFHNYLVHWDIIWFYGDVSDVVLRAPLWTDLFRGRIEGWILYSRRGWCGWRFNHDGWVKWGCHDIATWLTQANTSVGYKHDIFLFYLYKYYLCSNVFHLYIYIYKHIHILEKKNTGGLLSCPGPMSLRR